MSEPLCKRSDTLSGAVALAAYTSAVCLSAFLLFAVQPMFARMVLPRFGGSPSVWSVAMVFFQSMLFAGYAYAHLLARFRHRVTAVGVHVALLCAAGLTLPPSIARGWSDPPASGTALWLLGLFAVSIGLPFLALSASNPLLQAWFARTEHREGDDPYFLSAASNIGSFLALLSYPLLIEPTLALNAQDRFWSLGFAALIGLIAACGYLQVRAPRGDVTNDLVRGAPKPSWPSLGRWAFASAAPSGLLVAVTAHVSTDIAAAPLLWVAPLSIYLLTWTLVFSRRQFVPHRWMLLLQPLAVAAIVMLLALGGLVPLFPSLIGHLVAFFIIAMACHGQLALSRPAPAHLTEFYLSVSFGGMLGGIFAGLIAPFLFSWVAEYPVLAVLAVLCRPKVEIQDRIPKNIPQRWFWMLYLAVALILLSFSYVGVQFGNDANFSFIMIILALSAISVLLVYYPMNSAAIVALSFVLIRLYPIGEGRSESVRSFFGVHKVLETSDGRFRILLNGSTIHGAQRILSDDGKPLAGRPEPLTYYHKKSAMAAAIAAVRERKAAPLNVAVIGLGAGSLSCYSASGENWRFFEIDPAIVAIATDPKRFTFISSCAPHLQIVVGDARLTMAKEPDGLYDLIIVDAYSSDAIPVHLATQEAMAIYKRKLAPLGVVVMHISNKFLELESVAVGIAKANGLKTWAWSNPNDKADYGNFFYRSEVVVSAESPADIGALAKSEYWAFRQPNSTLRTWTDDYSNIAGAAVRRFMRQKEKRN